MTIIAGIVGAISADFTGWIWLAIVAFWIISAIVGAVRRALAKLTPQEAGAAAQRLEQTPLGRRLAPSAGSIYDDVKADLDQAEMSVGTQTSLSTQSFGAAQDADLEQRMRTSATAVAQAVAAMASNAATQASRAASQVSRAAAAGQPMQAPADLLAAASGMRLADLGAPTLPFGDAARSVTTPFDLRTALHSHAGLSFAILASVALGPCTGLRAEPQEPGGW